MNLRCVRRLIAATVTAAVLAAGLPACSGDRPIQLVVAGSAYDTSCNYWTRAVALYEEATGNTVTYLTDTAVDAALLTGKNAPDLMIGVGGEANLAGWNAADNLADLSEETWVSDVREEVLPQAMLGDRVIGLPFGNLYYSGILYDKLIFEQNDLSVPTNGAEFLDVCSRLVGAGYTPLYTAFADSWTVPLEAALDRALARDPALVAGLHDGSLSYADIPAVAQTLNWFQDMGDYGFFGTHYADNSYDGARAALSNPYAMALLPELFMPTDYATVWQFTYGSEYYGFFPLYIGDEALFPASEVKLVTVNRHSRHADAAREFLAFLAQPEVYNAAFAELYTAPLFNRQTGNLVSEQYTESAAAVTAHAVAPATATRVIGASREDALAVILDMMAGRLTAEEALVQIDILRVAAKE